MMSKFCWLLALIPCLLFSQRGNQNALAANNSSEQEEGPILKGVVLVDESSQLNAKGYTEVDGIETYFLNPPTSSDAVCNALFSFLGYPISSDLITCVKQAIIQLYQTNGRPVVAVTVPKQNISSGVLQVLVTESVLGDVTAQGSCWFDDETIASYVRLCPGEAINSKTLNVDLFWMNQNPFRRTDAIFVPSASPNTTNIELVTVDRFPLRLYGGIDNTGNDILGNNRVFGGFVWGNAFFLDQQLTYQFTASPNLGHLKSHTILWSIPLPWRDTVTIYGGYSGADSSFDSVETALTSSKFRAHGWNAQTSFRYDTPLRPYLPIFLNEFTWGFDWKRTNNNLEFAQVPIVGSIVNIFQLMAGFNAGYENAYLTTTFQVETFVSPGKWLPDQTKMDYGSIRPFSSSTYMYFRSASSLILRSYYDFAWHNYFRWQASTENLLPSEQYGIGGYDTVRGYKERAYNADDAIVWNTELRTPATKALGYWNSCIEDELQFLLFFDLGYGIKHEITPGELKSDLL